MPTIEQNSGDLIKAKNREPVTRAVDNTTHFVQCSNERSACPVFAGDTRIILCKVDSLKEENKIPKPELFQLLTKEAPDFLGEILKLELPRSNDRLNLPCIATDDKTTASKANQSHLELFLDEHCFYVPGEMILFSDFYDAFIKWLEPNDRYDWSKIKVGRSMPDIFPKGRDPGSAQWCFGNLALSPMEPTKSKIIARGDKLYHEIPSDSDTGVRV